MKRALLNSLAISLSLTIALEMAFFTLTRKWFTSQCKKKDFLLVVLVNVLTNPVVVLLYWLAAFYTNWNTILILTSLELFAVCTEGSNYKKYGSGFCCPYLFSAAANIFSFVIGMCIQLLI